ncbi:MAG TPA: MFS transporter [Chromatiaceae bacterium]|nr:MFS transporter [Chromatiaceae bacterium]HIN82855.1 MFS transporter [Chromatiales bacterium]
MTSSERRATAGLAGIFGLRMLGLFMVLPVFSLFVSDFPDATPFLLGFALSVYGLTQAILQIPFGIASDRIGRIPVILFGLALFAVGSLVAASAESINTLIIGRALQGCGAIAAAVMALLADLTREDQRTKAMALVGMSIGLSFTMSLILGPVLIEWTGLQGLFVLTAVFAGVAAALLLLVVPRAVRHSIHRDAEPVLGQFAAVLRSPDLLRLDVGILILHAILTCLFVSLPLILRDHAGLAASTHWQVYLPVLLGSVLLMAPVMMLAERRKIVKPLFLSAIVLLGISGLMLWLWHGSLVGLVAGLLVFFTAFNYLEANLPALISRTAAADSKGTAMGVYSSSQFFGIFVGGLLGGYLYGQFGLASTFVVVMVGAVIWFGFAAGMKNPQILSSYLLKVGVLDEAQAMLVGKQLQELTGVVEVVVVAEDGLAYLKIDRKRVDMQKLDEFLPGQG